MSTYIPKANEVERKWYLLDAEGKSLGKVAAEAATLLRGKHKPDFMPNVDTGDFVVIVNADKAVLTGKKLEQKVYYRFTGYIGNMKKIKYKTLMAEHPEVAMKKAVKGMVPDTTLGRKQLTRLHIYNGAEHKHAAQKPEIREF